MARLIAEGVTPSRFAARVRLRSSTVATKGITLPNGSAFGLLIRATLDTVAPSAISSCANYRCAFSPRTLTVPLSGWRYKGGSDEDRSARNGNGWRGDCVEAGGAWA